MGEWTHDSMVESGLLDGALDEATRDAWPAPARQHARGCPACHGWLRAEDLLVQAGQTVRVLPGIVGRVPPPPTSESLRRRMASHRAPPLAILVGGAAPFPRHHFRSQTWGWAGDRAEAASNCGALDISVTHEGVRAWDPDARHLAIYAAPDGSPPTLLDEAESLRPGVGIEVSYTPRSECRLVAIATRDPISTEHWALWLADALRSDGLSGSELGRWSRHVHVAQVRVRPSFQAQRIRVAEAPVVEPTPEVKAILKNAASAGRADEVAEAASLYRRALVRATTLGDESGIVRAALGLAKSLNGLGYDVDSMRVIEQVVREAELDRPWAAWVCLHLAHAALQDLDLGAARGWLDEGSRLSDGVDPRSVGVRMSVESADGNHARALSLFSEFDGSGLPETVAASARVCCARSLALLGEVERSEQLLATTDGVGGACFELGLGRERARAAIAQARGRSHDWAAATEEIGAASAFLDRGVLPAWDSARLRDLAEDALASGDERAAWRLLRLQHLDHTRAFDPGVPLLAICAGSEGLLAVDPWEPERVRRLPLHRAQLLKMVTEARQELQARHDEEMTRTLGALLFPSGKLPPGEVFVASDGLLAGAPMFAIASAAVGSSAPLPAIRELCAPRGPRPAAGEVTAVASLADARGDLPGASREVTPDRAAVHLRGHDVTADALFSLGPVGIIHLGVHAQREHGVATLGMADGPLSPAEISARRLEGAPVVVLAGCATAMGIVHRGVERSLASAFLQAGASAVVATHWPLDDRMASSFVRLLFDAWPFASPSAVVAHACHRLRQRGAPPRLWAASAVY